MNPFRVEPLDNHDQDQEAFFKVLERSGPNGRAKFVTHPHNIPWVYLIGFMIWFYSLVLIGSLIVETNICVCTAGLDFAEGGD